MTRSQDRTLGPMVDRYGRAARDLRVSLTDRCNLRCSYCMPEEGLPWIDREKILTDDEIIRLIRIAIEDLGIEKVRFTGGEPLLRKSLPEIIGKVSHLITHKGTRPTISLTTNGLSLTKTAEKLVAAGLDRINVSLDSMNPDRYQKITHRGRHQDVLDGLAAAKAAGLRPIKVNAVPQPEWYLEDAPALLKYCLENDFQLRFIEQMPIGPQEAWERSKVVTRNNLLEVLAEAGYKLTARTGRGSSPAELWDVAADENHAAGVVGIIASVTHPFCGACSRTRLTADGMIRTCLFANTETDLKTPMRQGASDEELAKLWRDATWLKPRAHGLDSAEFARPSRTMSAIGG